MHFHRGFAVFQRITLRHGFKRQLALFADGHEADIQLVGQRGADNETARVQTGHHVDFLPHVAVGKQIHQQAEIFRALQHGGDVVKQNAFFRPIGDFADFLGERTHAHHIRMENHIQSAVVW